MIPASTHLEWVDVSGPAYKRKPTSPVITLFLAARGKEGECLLL